MADPIVEKIERLKKKRNAVLLVHNYQLGEVQDIADHLGDSLGLSQVAASTDADVIVFCGVHFMAETAAILSPGKKVLLPDRDAGCPMADMITADQLREMKHHHPGAVVVCYVNSSAEVKAESDYCCTSANATAIVNSIDPGKDIIFVPDRYLGSYTARQTGREMILWQGYCPTHARISPREIERLKQDHPDALVMAHPECPPHVLGTADEILSTSGMCRVAQESDATEFIVATEVGMLHRLKKENPGKEFYPAAANAVCKNMKMVNLGNILQSLEDMAPVITVPAEIRKRALTAIQRMVDTVA